MDDSHIPTVLLAAWDRRAPRLTGEFRELVQHHLERCADCRRELETLGFDPGLIRQPRLEGPEVREPRRSGSQERRAIPPGPSKSFRGEMRLRWTRWHTATAATVATAAAVLLIVQAPLFFASKEPAGTRIARGPLDGSESVATPEPVRPPSSTVTPAKPSRPSAEPSQTHVEPSQSLLALGPAGPNAVLLAENLRGATAQVPVASLDFVHGEVLIEPPRSLALADGHRVEIALLDPSGAIRGRLETTMDALFPQGGAAIILRQGTPPLGPGRYSLRVRVWSQPGERTDESSYDLEIRP